MDTAKQYIGASIYGLRAGFYGGGGNIIVLAENSRLWQNLADSSYATRKLYITSSGAACFFFFFL